MLARSSASISHHEMPLIVNAPDHRTEMIWNTETRHCIDWTCKKNWIVIWAKRPLTWSFFQFSILCRSRLQTSKLSNRVASRVRRSNLNDDKHNKPGLAWNITRSPWICERQNDVKHVPTMQRWDRCNTSDLQKVHCRILLAACRHQHLVSSLLGLDVSWKGDGRRQNIRPCMVHTTNKINLHQPSITTARTGRTFIHMRHVLVATENEKPFFSTNSSKALVIRFTHPAPTNEFQLVSTRRANTQTRRAICMGSVGGRKEEEQRTYPELIGIRRCWLVVVGMEMGGRWSEKASMFVNLVVQAKARQAPPLLQTSLAAALVIPNLPMARFAQPCRHACVRGQFLAQDCSNHRYVEGNQPSLSQVLAEAPLHAANPSRSPLARSRGSLETDQ